MLMAHRCAPIFFLRHQKENGRARSKEKMFRRVGPRQRGPPAAGEGQLAIPRGDQGRKRDTLGVIQARGSPGYPLRRFSLPLTLPRRTSQRQRKEEQRPCVDRPDEVNTHSRGARPGKMSGPARAGRRPAVFTGTDSGDPRPRGGPLHRSAAKKRPFLLDRSAARFLFNKIEKKMGGGVHCRTPADSPPNEAASVLPLALMGLPPRREGRVFRGEGGVHFDSRGFLSICDKRPHNVSACGEMKKHH